MNELIVLKTNKNQNIVVKIIPYIILFLVIFMAGFCGYFFGIKFGNKENFTPIIIKENHENYNIQIRYPYIKNEKYINESKKYILEKIGKIKNKKVENKKLEYNLDYVLHEKEFLKTILFKEYTLIDDKKYIEKEKVLYYDIFSKKFLKQEDLFKEYEKSKKILDSIILKKSKGKISKDYMVILDKDNLKIKSKDNIITLEYADIKNILKEEYLGNSDIVCKYPIFENNKEKQRDVSKFKNKKVIALTFDDGPSKYTENLINELNKREAKATFFVLGSRIKGYENEVKIMYDNGFQIGNHSYSHRNFNNLSKEEILKEIDDTNKEINKVVGILPSVMRAPYGNKNIGINKDKKLLEIEWSIDTRDWKFRDSKIIKEHVLNNVKDGDIILFHDLYKTSVDAAIEIVDELKKQGYEFLTINEMIKFRNYQINYEDNIKSFRN